MIETPVHCPVCHQPCGEPFYTQRDCPVLSNVLCRTKEEAAAAPVGDIELRLCPSCGLIFNAKFDPARVAYASEYENALHFSAVFRAHERRLVDRLVDEHRVTDADVVEIGCGDAHFLTALCERGRNRGTGFDPAFDLERHLRDLPESITVHQELFTASSLGQLNPGCVVCRHVLEHLPQPGEFLDEVREGLDQAQGAIIYFEVPSAMHSLARRGFWDVIYEHHSYFTPQSFRILFERCGFDVHEVEETYSGQFVGLFGRPAPGRRESVLDAHALDEMRSLTERFGADYRSEIAAWSDRLTSASQQRVVAWGAGSKGVTFLNALGDAARRVEAIVDINPRKHGCYVVGAATPIVSPEEAGRMRPELVIVMNAAYREEVSVQLEQLGCCTEVLAVA